MAKYRKKPVVIEAEQFVWEKGRPVAHGDMFMEWPIMIDRVGVRIDVYSTLEGYNRVNPGDWIITDATGNRNPCQADIFAATYEAVEGGSE